MHFQIPFHLYRSKYPTKLLTLYHSLRDSILDGVLTYETRLPSSRELAYFVRIVPGDSQRCLRYAECRGVRAKRDRTRDLRFDPL